jgi:hypothetical protein
LVLVKNLIFFCSLEEKERGPTTIETPEHHTLWKKKYSMASDFLKDMAREVELQSRGKPPRITISGGAEKTDTKGMKTSTVVVAIALTVLVVGSVIVAIIVVNRDTEMTRNSNLVRIDDESDEDWQDFDDDYPKMLEKSKRLKRSRNKKNRREDEDEEEVDDEPKDPNFTLLRNLR